MRFNLFINLLFLAAFPCSAQMQKILLVNHSEMKVKADEIVYLPGLGLGIYAENDSIILLDDPTFMKIKFIESGRARSFASTRHGVYAAQGDSIIRMATDSLSHEFVGRLDNSQFTLSEASDSTFFATTADEEFSCVYEIFPETRECAPIYAVKAPILKIQRNGTGTFLWIDDCIWKLEDSGNLTYVYQADDITDMTLTPIGLMVASPKGVMWITSPNTGSMIIKEPVEALWWDNTDALYYLTSDGDLIASIHMVERYLEMMGEQK